MAKEKVVKNVLNAFDKGSDGERLFKETVEQAKKSGGGGKGGATTYGDPTKKDWQSVENKSVFTSEDATGQLKSTASAAWGGLQRAAMDEGRTVLGMAGQHAIRGAAWGAVGGGTLEAAQGGSFWDGAKQGAFNGAAGWTGYRMGMKAVGATSMNPFAGKNKGLFSSANTMYRSFSKDADISGQAVAILNNRQVSGIAQSVMNNRKKG